jgi:hypothetical protein
MYDGISPGDHDRISTDKVVGQQYGVTVTSWFILADGHKLNIRYADRIRQIIPSLRPQSCFQGGIVIEIVLNRLFVPGSNKKNLINARLNQFIDYMMNGRLTANGQHFLGYGFG